jgi:hypothetical protein
MIFNGEAALGAARERNCRLCNLLDDFNDKRLDLRLSAVGNRDRIGDGYEYRIGTFAVNAGKKAGAFYTPPEVSILVSSKGRELWVLWRRLNGTGTCCLLTPAGNALTACVRTSCGTRTSGRSCALMKRSLRSRAIPR